MDRMNKAKSWLQKKWNQGIALAKNHKGKTVAGMAVVSLFVAGSALANHYYTANTQTLYHVYVDGQEIGTVDNPARVNQYIQEQMAEEKANHQQLQIKMKNKIDFTEEVSRKEGPNTEETLKNLGEKIELQVAAQALIVNGETIGYAANQEDLDLLLNELKAKYGPLPVAGDKTNTVRAASVSSTDPDMEVKFKENVEIKGEQVSVDQVVSMEEIKMLLEKGTLQDMIHVVQEGDCIGCIAEKYGITSKDIYRNNPEINEDTLLQLGQEIVVTATKPKLTVQTVEQLQEDIQIDYQIEVKTNDKMFRGDSKVVQQGQEGLKRVTYQLIKENGIQMEKKVIEEEIISEPIKKIIEKGTKVKPDRGDGEFAWPAAGGQITSKFGKRWGRMHEGLDIAGVSNRTIKAADNGRVTRAGWYGNYGNCVIIDHGNGYKTLYGHLSDISVSVGDTVMQGEKIGVMGSTGQSTGVHLHFEILKNGVNKNPINYFRN